MQLHRFLKKNRTQKLNIIAINWSKELLNKSSTKKLNSLVRTLHPVIRVIQTNKEIDRHFSPLTAIPTNFLYDKTGQIIYGKENQGSLGIKKLIETLNTNDQITKKSD